MRAALIHRNTLDQTSRHGGPSQRYILGSLSTEGSCVSVAGLQSSNKNGAYPVRMDNSVPIVPQNQSAQSLQIPPSMLTQVCTRNRSLSLS